MNLLLFIKSLSIKKKLLLFYIIVILLPTSLGMIIYYKNMSEIAEYEINQAILQTLDQTEINLTSRLEDALDYANILTHYPNIYTLLSTDNEKRSELQQWEDFVEIKSILDSINFNPNLYGIRLFVDPSLNYSREQIQLFSLEELESEIWYKEMVEQKRMVYWKNTYLQSYIGKNDRYVISHARALINPNNFNQIVGVLLIDIYEEDIYNTISTIHSKSGQNVYIVNERGFLISHENKSLLGRKMLNNVTLDTIAHSSKGFFKETGSGEDHYMIYKKIPLTNWTLITEIPVTEMAKSTATLNKISGIVLIVSTFIIFMLILILGIASAAQRTNNRIRDMIDILNTDGLIGIEKSLEKDSGDLYKLEKNISGIVKSVKKLTANSYQAQIREREAQLRALQAQINPHFLYNTLDTINWMAIRKKDREISNMVLSLSKYFRLSLNKGKDIVSVEDEINLAKAYIHIQKRGYEDRFESTFNIDERVKQFQIPKLTLQPIIENALIHGILKKRDQKGILQIDASIINNQLVFIISDNGPGMNTDQLKQLTSSEKSVSGYGIYNVNERLKMFFDGNSEIQIDSNEGSGTTVKITLGVNIT